MMRGPGFFWTQRTHGPEFSSEQVKFSSDGRRRPLETGTMASQESQHSLRNYVIRRLLLMIPTFFGVTVIVFALCQFVPGGPIDQLRMQMAGARAGAEGGGGASRSTMVGTDIPDKHLKALKEYYNVDKPVHQRYARYVAKLLTLDLGTSFRYSTPAIDIISRRLPVSVFYGLVTTILTYAICIPLGIVKAIRHRTFLDDSSSFLIYLGYAIPNYALGAVLLALFSVKNDFFPLGGFKSDNYDTLSPGRQLLDVLHHSVLPLICYMVGSFAFMTTLMKNSLIENLSADYVRTGLAMGATSRRMVFVHAFRNSLIPLATSFGNNISLILAGSLLIERVFNIPGMGLLFYEAIQSRDYPVVMGITVISTILMLLGNLLSDLCVALVDPRVRFS
jgi:microcin C transport system permease protein